MTLAKTRYRVDGMDCGACARKIETAVRQVPGVADVSVSAPAQSMVVEHTPSTNLAALAKKVSGLGYSVSPDMPPEAGRPAPATSPWSNWMTKYRPTVLCGLALVLAFVVSKLAPQTGDWPFTVAMLVGLLPIARRAVVTALAGSPFSIEMLMTIAAIGAVFIGAPTEGAAVVFLFLVGQLLEGVAAGRARASIRALTQLVPSTALRLEGDQTRETPVADLAIGDRVLVRPGDRIPADGVILTGEGDINEAPVTGESVPVQKKPADQVFAGTINVSAVLTVRVTASSADNTIARVVRLVEEAQESKAPTERFIDRFSRYYTPVVVLIAILVAILPPLAMGAAWGTWIYRGLAILLIGCPCALVISTPAAIAASLSSGARRGLLIKGGVVLEALGRVTLAAFDKTGTLTTGNPVVTDITTFGAAEAAVLRYAAALEAGSSHPLATAILAKAKAEGIVVPAVTDAKAFGGQGVWGLVEGIEVFVGSPQAMATRKRLSAGEEAAVGFFHDEGKTVAVVLRSSTVLGIIAMRDEPRADARDGLERLRRSGVKTVMLTGDHARAAKVIGEQLGIEVRAELLPEDKQRIVREYQAKGFNVAKIGDGINDAPALAAANVGIAMGGGTDVALETAGGAALHGRVVDIADMIELSKRTMRNIRQNITIAIGLKVIFLATTVVGITGLWPAIMADTGATVLVTMNAMRLLAVRQSSTRAT